MQDRDIRRFGLWLITAAVGILIVTAALADTYPISGKWTYDNPRAEGPAEDCGARYMSFEGNARRTTVGGVSFFSNFKVEQIGDSRYRITDQFDNGMISARQIYNLRIVDSDHIELDLSAGPVIALRRCA
jgi:hypothetical protein